LGLDRIHSPHPFPSTPFVHSIWNQIVGTPATTAPVMEEGPPSSTSTSTTSECSRGFRGVDRAALEVISVFVGRSPPQRDVFLILDAPGAPLIIVGGRGGSPRVTDTRKESGPARRGLSLARSLRRRLREPVVDIQAPSAPKARAQPPSATQSEGELHPSSAGRQARLTSSGARCWIEGVDRPGRAGPDLRPRRRGEPDGVATSTGTRAHRPEAGGRGGSRGKLRFCPEATTIFAASLDYRGDACRRRAPRGPAPRRFASSTR
jgi:hypothetical protein